MMCRRHLCRLHRFKPVRYNVLWDVRKWLGCLWPVDPRLLTTLRRDGGPQGRRRDPKGGKGQHTVIAAAREAGFIASSAIVSTEDAALSLTRLRLSHVAFLGSGEEVRRMLHDALPLPRAAVALDDVSVDTTSAGSDGACRAMRW
jgi:hypothetical protein